MSRDTGRRSVPPLVRTSLMRILPSGPGNVLTICPRGQVLRGSVGYDDHLALVDVLELSDLTWHKGRKIFPHPPATEVLCHLLDGFPICFQRQAGIVEFSEDYGATGSPN